MPPSPDPVETLTILSGLCGGGSGPVIWEVIIMASGPVLSLLLPLGNGKALRIKPSEAL